MGKPARVVTICQAGRVLPSVEATREAVMGLVDQVLSLKPDLVCLPENFATAGVKKDPNDDRAETVPGPTTDAAAQRARQGRCYVVCPSRTRRDGRLYNSAVILDRKGEIAGVYDKVHPVTSSNDYTIFEQGLAPGREAPVFDLDFGRVGVQICYDAGFPETWEELARKGARMILWPSAYNGGFPLRAYAYLHHVYVVSSVRTDKSRIIDPLGAVLAETDAFLNVAWRDINLDFAVCHTDFHNGVPEAVQAAYGDRVEVRTDRDSGHLLVEPKDAGLTIERLQKEFGFESTFVYHERHRQAFRQIHAGRLPTPQAAAHGDRQQHGKPKRK